MFDYSALRGRIVEKFGTNKNFARKIDMLPSNLSMKLGNKCEWKQSEIEKACSALEVEVSEITKYFFTVKV